MDYFKIETKWRKLCNELLAPTIRRMHENSETVNKLWSKFDRFKRKVDIVESNS